MKLTNTIYQKSFFFAIACSIIALWGFWPTYYSNPFKVEAFRVHFHAITMTAWCLLLISQTVLIKYRNYTVHKIMGKLSYVLAALIFVGLLLVVQHIMFSVLGSQSSSKYSGTFFIFFSTILFGLCYSWAIYRRDDPATHGRIMLCTVFPLLPAATDRIIGNMVKSAELTDQLIALVYFLAGVLALLLSIWDWRSHKRLNVFPVVLLTMLIFHTLVWLAPEIRLWRNFADWFGAI
ncbi:MAG: hypothetical protein ACI9MF_001761 [Gammaproteobacteria bacterium]|jgi:hypothetical protein